MSLRLRSLSSRWIFAIFAASGLLLGSAARTCAQPQNDDGAKLQKQIEEALKELKKIDPNDQAANPDDLRRRLEEIRGQLGAIRAIPPRNGFGRRATPPVIGSRFGAIVQVPPPVIVDQLDLPANKGLVVLDVQPDSPAEKAGIRKNDILLEFAGKQVPSDLIDFTNDVRDHKVGEEVDAVVMRRGKRETIKGIKLAEFQAALEGIRPPAFVPQQRIPQVRIENLPGVANVLGGNNESMRVRVDNDGFQVEMTNGNLKATLKGSRENNKMTPQEIRIQDGETVVETRDMAQVPERYRPLLERMLRGIGATPVVPAGGARRE
jgi:PDZ domain